MRSSWNREDENPFGRGYWNRQGNRFNRSFFGAKSTLFYLEQEQRLCKGSFGDLQNKKLLKLDAWNEAQNTEVLFWAAQQGAECYTVDIAESTAFKAQARSHALNTHIRIAVADIAELPFPDGTFDLLYAVGVIEHSHHQSKVLSEISRVLSNGGIAIIGVPNKLDPFLFYLGSKAMQKLRLYPYGYEKWYTNNQLAEKLESTGLRVIRRDGILFLPWFLRFLDLFFWLKAPILSCITGFFVEPFRRLSNAFEIFRKLGYLTVCVVQKPYLISAATRPTLPHIVQAPTAGS
jgi:SAM-dependent methyltransferase